MDVTKAAEVLRRLRDLKSTPCNSSRLQRRVEAREVEDLIDLAGEALGSRDINTGPDGACSDLVDLAVFLIDDKLREPIELIDDLALFIERKGLSDEAETWLHGRLDGTVEGRS